MTPITLPLKERHEVAIANQLLRFLRLDNAKLIRHGTDGIEPDAIYSINRRIVGIEVATAYYNQKHAKGEWQFVRGILKPDPTGWAKICDVIAFPDKLIEASVQSEIEDKCAKTYSGVDEAWLCIERHAQATEVAETEDFLPRAHLPEHCLVSDSAFDYWKRSRTYTDRPRKQLADAKFWNSLSWLWKR